MLNKSNDEVIFELRGRFLNLNYNNNILKMKSLQADCETYLSSNKDNEYKHIENTIHILKAAIDYSQNDNRESAYKKILPLLENLEFGKKADLFVSRYNRILELSLNIVCGRTQFAPTKKGKCNRRGELCSPVQLNNIFNLNYKKG